MIEETDKSLSKRKQNVQENKKVDEKKEKRYKVASNILHISYKYK